MIERPASRDRPNPTFVLTFAAGDDLPRRALQRWIARQSLFADSALRRARVEDLRGVYVPGYLYSAVARSSYRARIGEDYTETETYTEKDESGRSVTKTRNVTRTEWHDLAGQHVGYVTDVIVTASRGLPDAELHAVEPFDWRQLRRYDASLVSGWLAEEPSRTHAECLASARETASARQRERLLTFMPGDHCRDLRYQTTVEWEELDPVLVPLWVLAVRYRPDAPPLRVVVNGQTGVAHGKAPLSWWKLALAGLFAAALVASIIYLVVTR